MKKLLLVTGILASGSLMAAAMPAKHLTPTATGPQGWYVGIGLIAPDSFSAEMNLYAGSYGTAKFKQDNYPLGGEIFAGYRVNQNFGTEFNFSYLSDMKWKLSTSSSAYPGLTGETSMKNKETYKLSYDGILYMPIMNGFEVFGKAGIGFLHQKSEVSASGVSLADEKVNTLALNYGVGVGYNYEQFGISLDYTKFKPTKTISDTGYIADLVGLDVQYNFG